jgi:hypothetical protein
MDAKEIVVATETTYIKRSAAFNRFPSIRFSSSHILLLR